MAWVALLARLLPRRPRARVAVALIALLGLVAAGAWANRPQRAPDPPVRPAAEIDAEQRAAQEREAAAAQATTATSPQVATSPAGRASLAPATVPDVPRSWQRIAAQAEAWPAATDPIPIGAPAADLPTVPAARVRDTIGLNIDTWRTEAGYRDFAPVLAKVAELQLRHARVNMSASGGEWGVARLQGLGRIGVRLNLIMGDAFGRYGTAPYETLDARLDRAVMPYVDSLEGTNEPDLAKQADWPTVAREHQRRVVRSAEPRRGRPVAVVAPSLGRLANLAVLGEYDGLADAANAHAYSSAAEPSAPLDSWLAGLKVQLKGGTPAVVTEVGFNDDLGQRRWHLPLPPAIAADYVPRIILEAMRRGIPRVYLYEMIDRWGDPFHVDTSAHFGLLTTDLTPKPAWNALLRLQKALLDGGQPDRDVAPLEARVVAGPQDLRLLAFRRSDGTAALAIWRAVSEWDAQAGVATPVSSEKVSIEVDGVVGGALATTVATGGRERLTGASTIDVRAGGSPIIVDGIR